MFNLTELRINKPIRRSFIVAMIVLAIILVSSRSTTQLESIKSRGELRVGTRPGVLTYYEKDGEADGLDYHLTKAFADYLGVALKTEVISDIDELFNAIGGPRIDMAAASLTITPEREKNFRFSHPYLPVQSRLIQRKDQPIIQSPEQLIGKEILVIKGSAHAEALKSLQRDYPDLTWKEEPDLIMYELMQKVSEGLVELAIVDSTAWEMEQSFFTNIHPTLEFDKPSQIAWAFQLSDDTSLISAANKFLKEYEKSGALKSLIDSFYEHANRLTLSGTLTFDARLDERLPEFESLFKRVAKENEMDWMLLAAIAYQESHWDPNATSPTGVRGLMMLTNPTAEQLGVTDRLDPYQSLSGGAVYPQYLIDKMPNRIEDSQKLRLALAAYNIGFAHLEDARVLTQRHGGNPDLWVDVKRHLPLLQNSEYYNTLKYGYARGSEAVAYVENIFKYYNTLQWHSWRNGINTNFRREVIETQDFRQLINSDFDPL